jgi:hypothetical protein
LIEWDARIPSFDEVHAESLKARSLVAWDSVPGEDREPARGGIPGSGEVIPHPAHLTLAEVE